MSRRDGWTAADAVAYCEDKFARAKGGSVAASRRVKFIGTCLDNDDQAGGKAGNATLGKPPRRPVKALCIGCAAVADDIDSDETAERRELEILAWGIDPDEVMPSSWGFGYCAEHWTGLNAETRRDLVERMQGHPPCELCGRSYAIADEQAYDIRHGGRPTLRRCPHCWRVGDPWAVVEPEPASVPEADRPTPDPAPAALDAQQPARLAAGAVVAAPVPDRVAVPYSWQQAVRGGKCPSCDSPAVVLVDGCGFYCEPHSR